MIEKLVDQTLEVFTDDKYLAEYVIANDISKQRQRNVYIEI